MTQKVTFVVDAQHAPAIASFLDVSNAIQLTTSHGRQAGDALEDAGKRSGREWDRGLSILKSYPAAMLQMVSGATAVYSVVHQLREELERIPEVRLKALAGLDQVAEPYKRATLQFSEEFRATPDWKKLTTEGIRARGDAAGYWDALANAISAAGGGKGLVPEIEILQAASLVSQFANREAMPQEDFNQLLSATIEALRVERRKGSNIGAKELFGSLLSMFPASRPTSMQAFATYELQFQNLVRQNTGASREEAAGFAATYGTLMTDPWGRQSRTGELKFVKGLAEAYNFASAYGAPLRDAGGRPMDIHAFRQLGILDQLRAARADTPTGRYMQAFLLGPLSKRAEARDLAIAIKGMDYAGALEGEAGAKETAEVFLDPTNKVMEEIADAIKVQRHGVEAERYLDRRMGGFLVTTQDKLFAAQAAQRSALAGMKWSNVDLARRGSMLQFVQELEDVYGGTALGKKVTKWKAIINASRKDQEGITEAELAAAEEFVDAFTRLEPVNANAFVEWARANYPEAERGGVRTMFERGFRYRPGSPVFQRWPEEVVRQYQRATLSPDRRSQVESLEEYIRTGREILQRSRGGAAAAGASVPETGSRDAAGPAPTDQSLNQVMQRLERAADAMEKLTESVRTQSIAVTVEDGVGRQIARTTSRPRAFVELSESLG